jgi:hypothetical protein
MSIDQKLNLNFFKIISPKPLFFYKTLIQFRNKAEVKEKALPVPINFSLIYQTLDLIICEMHQK